MKDWFFSLFKKLKRQPAKEPEKILPHHSFEIFFEAPIPIFICDKRGLILDQNRTSYHTFGFCKGRYLANFLPGIRLRSHHTGSLTLRTKGGHFDYYVEGDEPYFVYLLDKTELYTLKEEYRFSISYLSHELKTPIAVVRAKIEALLDEAKGGAPIERLIPQLLELSDKLSQLSNLVKKLFQMSSVLVKELKVSKTPVKISHLVEDLKMLTEDLAKEKGVELLFIVEPNLEVNVDPELFFQALLNLLENAIKFSPPKGKVILSVKHGREEIVFKVEDEGPGVPEEELPFLTRPFYRARVLGKGLGLGLYLVETIVKAHGGRLKLKNASPPSKGFIAEITLKVQPT